MSNKTKADTCDTDFKKEDEEFFIQRTQMLKQLAEKGIETYPHGYDVTHTVTLLRACASEFPANEKSEEVVSSAGRIVTIRQHGKAQFFDLESNGTAIQLVINTKDNEPLRETTAYLRRGDIVGFKGYCGKTKTGEPSVFVFEMKLLTPCLRVIPCVKNGGLKNPETIYRKRHIDLLVNKDSRDRFLQRTKIINYMRNFFNSKDFVEVETPMMHVIHGGAAAKPFKTFHNELNQSLYLRIAPELYLKKLVVGGFDRVFEIGKNFRNEGIDLTHNPEFTACEAYVAYGDHNLWMSLTEELLNGLANELKGSSKFTYEPKKRDCEDIKVELDFSVPFKRYDILEELNSVLGLNLTGENIEESLDELIKAAEKRNLVVDEPKTLARVLDKFVGEYLEPKCINPTFVTGFPLATSPLSKEDRNRKGLTERFELFINGKEICNSYTELNIPSDQRDRFMEQMAAKKAGDSEAMPIDEDYCQTLEYGLPPSGGWGIGIDRLVMYLTNAANIRDVIFFPAMRPEND